LRDGRPLRDQRRIGRVDKSFAQYAGRRVLVADDSPVNREVAVAALARFGVTIDLVENGVEAVAAVEKQTYHLILMDGSMPEMDGFEAAQEIRADEKKTGRPRLPIVALTAHVLGAAAEAWRDADMDGILHKPFTLQALAECLAAWLGEPSAEAKSESVVAEQKAEAVDAEETPVLNPEVIGQLRELAAAGKPEFLHRVCALYREHAPRTSAQIRDALANGDLENLGRLAHGLKSMSYNIGAARVAEAALGLERLTRAGRKWPQGDDLAQPETETAAGDGKFT
jgi:CheY-like chemotaxis protein